MEKGGQFVQTVPKWFCANCAFIWVDVFLGWVVSSPQNYSYNYSLKNFPQNELADLNWPITVVDGLSSSFVSLQKSGFRLRRINYITVLRVQLQSCNSPN